MAILTSCNNSTETFDTTENFIISEESRDIIQSFIDRVEYPESNTLTRSDYSQQIRLRVYYPSNYLCAGAHGSCLPNIIVSPDNSIKYPSTSWQKSTEGSQLQSLVNNGKLTLTSSTSSQSSTTFYVYKGTEDPGLELVVPVLE